MLIPVLLPAPQCIVYTYVAITHSDGSTRKCTSPMTRTNVGTVCWAYVAGVKAWDNETSVGGLNLSVAVSSVPPAYAGAQTGKVMYVRADGDMKDVRACVGFALAAY